MLEYFATLVLLSFIMAHIVPNLLLRRLRQMPWAQSEPEPKEPQPSDKTDTDDGFYHPTPIDIVVVRVMLTRSAKLPPTLVDQIFEDAEYWAHSTNVIDYQAEQQEPLRINGSSMTEDKFLVSSAVAIICAWQLAKLTCISFSSARIPSDSPVSRDKTLCQKSWPTIHEKRSLSPLGPSTMQHTLPS